MSTDSSRRARFVAWLVLLSGACANTGDGATPATTTTTVATARPEFLATQVQVRAQDVKFPQTAFTASAGDVTIGYVNDGKIAHTLGLETVVGDPVADWQELKVNEHGDVAIGTVTLTPGDYTLFCTIAGHRVAGMEASLIVSR